MMSSSWTLFSGSALLAATWAAGCSASDVGTAATPTTSDDGGVEASPPTTLSNECPKNSGFPGDDMCLAPPPPSEGFQLHYGTTEYANPAKVAPFVLAPNDETVDCYFEKTPNTEDRYVSGYEFSMRPGSHHILVDVNTASQADGFATCQPNDMTPGTLGGSQTPTVDDREDPAPENLGLASKVAANSQAVINFHVINTGEAPIMREAWLNYFYIPASQVKGIRGNVFLTGGIGFRIAPGTSKTYAYSCSPSRPVRVLSLAAHMHVHSSRMTAWKVSASQPTLVYEAYDWAEPVSIRYDSVHKNSPPNRTTKTPGGMTGALVVEPGDTLQWECAVDNTSNETLTFRNEVYTGEMCILTGVEIPVDNPMQPYDFECTRN